MENVFGWRRLIRYSIAALFLVAVIAKCRAFYQVVAMVKVSGLFPADMAVPVAYAIPAMELILVLVLLLPSAKMVQLSSAATIGVCSLFLTFSIWRGLNGIKAPCSCFGILFRMSPIEAILLNLAILGLILLTDMNVKSRPTTAPMGA